MKTTLKDLRTMTLPEMTDGYISREGKAVLA